MDTPDDTSRNRDRRSGRALSRPGLRDEEALNAMPHARGRRLIDEPMATNQALPRAAIRPGEAWRRAGGHTVRVRNRRLSATDGPFAETHEQLGGFLLIEARDLNEAIQIAGRIPGARLGSVEVRPVIDLQRERSGP